jgi:hypothetical protein
MPAASPNLIADEANVYKGMGKKFDGHRSANHSAEEYVGGIIGHANTGKSFAILKRCVYGTFHSAPASTHPSG